MIGITIMLFFRNKAEGEPSPVNIVNTPKLFGICIYSFMCHHSLPSMITPIKNKKRLNLAIILDYFLVLIFYLLIALTAIFAFKKLEQVYTLNFEIDRFACNFFN